MSMYPSRFSPDAAPLPAFREYHDWRAARWPATARTWRARRWIARRIEACDAPLLFAARAIRNFAELIHGQPRVSQRVNFAGLPPRQVSSYVARLVHYPRLPFAATDLDFLAGYCAAIPEALDALDPELRAAVIARQGGAA